MREHIIYAFIFLMGFAIGHFFNVVSNFFLEKEDANI